MWYLLFSFFKHSGGFWAANYPSPSASHWIRMSQFIFCINLIKKQTNKNWRMAAMFSSVSQADKVKHEQQRVKVKDFSVQTKHKLWLCTSADGMRCQLHEVSGGKLHAFDLIVGIRSNSSRIPFQPCSSNLIPHGGQIQTDNFRTCKESGIIAQSRALHNDLNTIRQWLK